MTWLFAILIVLAMGGVALAASGRIGTMPAAYDDRPDARVPAGDLTGDDLRRVRFSLGLRGYRMSEVDALLTRLADQLDGERAGAASPTEAGEDGPDDRAVNTDRHGSSAPD
ncbi:DivIVA domain-containing protein [Nocardioides sp. LHG3406-4]|uniref:DivIVA domain-containing protein n=1 Tax=Nocardioides sp. LHG3406-4 TaxID=2804575 RepID=UPI003CEA4B22